jgi:hemerythrin-like domain-containing protein
MSSIRTLMTDDHRRCDDLFAAAEQAVADNDLEAAATAFAGFQAAILAHFEAEENTLFPTFEAKTGMSHGPTQVMCLEHVQLRSLLEAAGEALRAGQGEDYLGQAESLLFMMQQHNMKEENILYPMCDQHLVAELPAVLERLNSELIPA